MSWSISFSCTCVRTFLVDAAMRGYDKYFTGLITDIIICLRLSVTIKTFSADELNL